QEQAVRPVPQYITSQEQAVRPVPQYITSQEQAVRPVPQYITSQEQAVRPVPQYIQLLVGCPALLISTNFRLESLSNAIAHGFGQVLLVKSQV
ncbi:hypothetical protein, partial [Microcoleus sp. S13_C3]|uniref:hypothetical protein n=1 Tax=Microcoleus sp. S13_C3 TaxID=3055409 RepID=UPI002FCFD630